MMTGGCKTENGMSQDNSRRGFIFCSWPSEQVQDLQAEEPRLACARCDVNFGCFRGAMISEQKHTETSSV